ncbi:MAG TPA: phasin family protein [Alphaproteobacteria bacterium]
MAEGKNDKARKDEAQSGGRRAAAAAHNFAEASRDAGEAGRRGIEEAGEAGRRTAEQMRGVAEEAGEAAQDIYSRSARETAQGLEAAMKYGTVLASGMQTFWQEWIGCAQDVMQRNVDGMQNLMRSRSPGDFFAAQSELLRDEVQAMIDTGSRMSEVSARIASDAARAFGEQLEEGEGDEGERGQRGQRGGQQFGRGGQQQGRPGQQQGRAGQQQQQGRAGQQQGGMSRT